MKTFKHIITTLTLIALLTPVLYSQASKTSLGMFFKVINNVEKKSVEKDWHKAARGEAIYPGNEVQTKKSSVAVIRFTDKSMIRVLENSRITMLGDRDKKSASNDTKLDKGTIGFEIKKQQNEEYTFTSPTSVASIRGTMGRFGIQDEFDILIVKLGIVNLKNKKSGKDSNVGAGEAGLSYPDGNLEVRKATPDELNAVDTALKAGDAQKENELKFELKDNDGNKKDLKIKYRE